LLSTEKENRKRTNQNRAFKTETAIMMYSINNKAFKKIKLYYEHCHLFNLYGKTTALYIV
jgi:hypothetical protein